MRLIVSEVEESDWLSSESVDTESWSTKCERDIKDPGDRASDQEDPDAGVRTYDEDIVEEEVSDGAYSDIELPCPLLCKLSDLWRVFK